MSKISVVMCTYNGECYLKKQIDSILCQTYPVHEIIIRDDCSKDNTWKMLEEYRADFPSIFKISKNEFNLGYGRSFNLAMQGATGDFIAFSDQDDIWLPEKITTLLDVIKDKFLVISNSRIYYDDALQIENQSKTLFQTHGDPRSTSVEKLVWDNNIFGHTFMINSVLLKYLKKVDIQSSHDATIAIICYALNSVAVTDTVLQLWRRHSQAHTLTTSMTQTTGNIKGYQKMMKAIADIVIGRKSMVVEEGWERIQNILKMLIKEEENIQGNIKKLCKLSGLMEKQSLFSYFKASRICWELRREMFDEKEISSFKKKYGIYTFVYRWWYDHRFDMSI